MQAGKLRHRVKIQTSVNAQDPVTGGISPVWQDTASVWAEVYFLSAREFIAAQAGQSEVTARITIRYRTDISAKCRIIFRGKIFNIEGVLPDPNSGLEYFTLPCSQGVNDG